MTPRKSLFCKL